jgi:hypothetical protein
MRAQDQLAELRGRIDSLSTELIAVKKQADRIEELIVAEKAASQSSATNASPAVAETAPPALTDPATSAIAPAAFVEPPPLPPELPPERQAQPLDARVEPAEPEFWGRVRATLEQLQLWPPSDETNAEVRLGAWWATRIGLLCAVIGAVFFGVYVSQFTPAWVKLAELVGVTVGVGVLGLWLERRVPKFGAALVGGALALGYFAAYGAYALPALKVLDSAVAGAAAQIIAAMVVFGAAWRRAAPAEAVLAVSLGLVAAAFSASHGLPNWALLVGFGLSAAAVAMRWRFGWEAPSVVALPGAFALLAWTGWSVWSAADGPVNAWIWTAAFAVLFGVRDWGTFGTDGQLRLAAGVRTFAGANVTLALAVGALLSWRSSAEIIEQFYFGAGIAVGLAAFGLRRRVAKEPLVAVWLAKSTALIGLGVISICDARTRWIVLLVQAVTMLATAQRLRERSLWWLSLAVAMAAAGFFALFAERTSLVLWQDLGWAALTFVMGWAAWAAWAERTSPAGGDADQVVRVLGGIVLGGLIGALAWAGRETIWTPPVAFTAIAAAWVMAVRIRVSAPAIGAVVGAVALAVATLVRLHRADAVAWGPVAWMAASMLGFLLIFAAAVERERPENALLTGGVLAVFAACVVLSPAWRWTDWAPALAALAGCAVGVGVWSLRLRSWAMVAAGLLLAAEAAVLTGGATQGLALWINLAPILVLAVAGAWAIDAAATRWATRNRSIVAWMLVGPAVLVLSVALRWQFALGGTLIAAGLLAFALVALAERAERLPLRAGALIPLGVAVTQSIDFGGTVDVLGLLGLVAIWTPLVWMHFRQRVAAVAPAGALVRFTLQAMGTWVLIWTAVTMTRGEHGAAIALTIGGAALVLLAAWPGIVAGLVSVTALMLLWAVVGIFDGQGPANVAVAWVGALLWLGAPIIARRALQDPLPRWRKVAIPLHGVVTLAVLMAVSHRAGAVLQSYATVGWGLAAVAVFIAGVFGRERTYRLLALGAVALAVGRVFLVDLDSTFTRIGAFIGVGVLLLWVGFSYHRFRRWIIEEPPGAPPTGKG